MCLTLFRDVPLRQHQSIHRALGAPGPHPGPAHILLLVFLCLKSQEGVGQGVGVVKG